ncbi:hypothetical protein AB0G49_17010 [Streptomyces longwoodensis]|uniref:hypothetical protein n=1 Tax=Streptomyces longwoodensis TaxID=68231 RepID=UPI0033E52F8C
MDVRLENPLAYGGAHEPSDWAGIAAILVLYLLFGYALEYRSKKSKGVARPAKAAVKGLFSERDGIDPGQRFASRMLMLGGAGVTGLTRYFTRTAPTAVQFLAMGVVGLLCIFGWAYYDYRTEPRDESSA